MANMKKNVGYEGKTATELVKEHSELLEENKRLKREIEIAKLKLEEMGVKEDGLKQLGILQKSKKKRGFIVKPIHPGEILREELLIPRDMSPEELAQEIRVPKEIVK